MINKQEWQPIKTAPLDGKQVLIYYKNDCNKGRIIKAKYVKRFTEESSIESENYEYSEEKDEYFTPEGWYEIIDNWDEFSHVSINYIPTHWMPLPPEPPSTPSQK